MIAALQDFHEIAENRAFSNTNYPYSTQGASIMRIMLKSLKWSSIFASLFFVMKLIEIFSGAKEPNLHQFHGSGQSWYDTTSMTFNMSAIQTDLQPSNFLFLLRNLGSMIVVSLEWIFSIISISALVLIVLTIPAWIFFAIKRNQNYERNCFVNDITASNLKSALIRKMALNRRLRSLNHAYSKARESSSNLDQISKLDVDLRALTAIKSMRVHVNTRQSLNGDEIETQYRIEFTTEDDYAAYEKMMQELKKIDNIADVAVRGKVSFGQISESRDRSTLTVKAVKVETDKYDFSDWVDGEDLDSQVFEYTFHLNHLIDKRAEIKKLSHKAQLWAERTGSALDEILTTSNAKVDRLSTFVSASNALFTYKISFRIDVQNFEKFQDSLDTAFGTTGTSVQIKDGDLLIAVPLPSDLIVPIDVGSMYREIFGNDEESN